MWVHRATRGVNGASASEAAHVDVKELPAGLKSANTDASANSAGNKAPPAQKPPVSISNLPGPVQEAQEAQAAVAQLVKPDVDSQTQRVKVEPSKERINAPEPVTIARKIILAERAAAEAPAPISRTETTDSVQIIGDVLA